MLWRMIDCSAFMGLMSSTGSPLMPEAGAGSPKSTSEPAAAWAPE